jgi:hypothetical protein
MVRKSITPLKKTASSTLSDSLYASGYVFSVVEGEVYNLEDALPHLFTSGIASVVGPFSGPLFPLPLQFLTGIFFHQMPS